MDTNTLKNITDFNFSTGPVSKSTCQGYRTSGIFSPFNHF